MVESAYSLNLVDSLVVEPPVRIRNESRKSRPKARGAKTVKAHRLTDRQQSTLDIIRRHLKVRGVPPSRLEIARELGIRHQGGVDAHINALAKKGF